MAKKTKSKVNVSKLIRDYLDENPEGKPSEIVLWLENEHDVPGISPQYVSTIKSTTKRKFSALLSDDPAVYRLQKAKEFINAMGGASAAHQAINDFQSLTGP